MNNCCSDKNSSLWGKSMLANFDLRSTLQTNELCFVKFSYILSNFTFSCGWVVQNQDERPTQPIVRLKLRLNLAILPSLSFYYSLVHYFPGWVGGSTEKLRIKTISAQLKLKLGLSLAIRKYLGFYSLYFKLRIMMVNHAYPIEPTSKKVYLQCTAFSHSTLLDAQ